MNYFKRWWNIHLLLVIGLFISAPIIGLSNIPLLLPSKKESFKAPLNNGFFQNKIIKIKYSIQEKLQKKYQSDLPSYPILENSNSNNTYACAITSVSYGTVCNDNNTTNINDDYYYINIDPIGTMLGSTYDVTGTYGAGNFSENDIAYGSAYTLAVAVPIGIPTDITITDDTDPSCTYSFRLGSPAECSSPFECWAVADQGDPDQLFHYSSATDIWTKTSTSSGVYGIESIAYDPANNKLYTANYDHIGTLDITTGLFSTLPGSTKIDSIYGPEGAHDVADIDGMSFDVFTGILWASVRRSGVGVNDYIFQVDVSTGDAIADAFGPGVDYIVSPAVYDSVINQLVYDVDDIAIDPVSGNLYLVANDGGAGGVLVVLDKTDGSLIEVVGNFGGVDDIESLGFFNSGNLFGSTGDNGPDTTDSNRFFVIDKFDASLEERSAIDTSGTHKDFEACDCLTGSTNIIKGKVFFDENKNGIGEVETGLADVLIYLYRDVDADSMYTDGVDFLLDTISTVANGSYSFVIASSGDFLISLEQTDLPLNYFMTTDTLQLAAFYTTGICAEDNDFGFGIPCDLKIQSAQVVNCTGTAAGYEVTASWFCNPSGDINYQLNDEGIQSLTPSGDTAVFNFTNVLADGDGFDTLRIWFAEETTCGDTLIIKRPVACFPDVPSCSNSAGCLGGNTFQDFNCDGIDAGANEPGVQGVKVIVYDCENNPVDTVWTDRDGDWSICTGITDGTAYRVEFLLPESISCWANPTHVGGDNGSDVQFITAPACANFSLSNPNGYCEALPSLATACYTNGNMLMDDVEFRPGYYDVLVGYQYGVSGKSGDAGYVAPDHLAKGGEIGVIWGLAYDKSENNLYSASFLKRHTGFPSSDSLGVIWKTADPNGTPTNSLFIDLVALGENVGQNLLPADRMLGAYTGDQSQDSIAFHLIGKAGLGDLDISDDNKYLYVVNLYTKEILEIEISTNTISNRYSMPDMGCVDGETRPFALNYHQGKLYVGGVCSAENGGTSSDLKAAVYELNGTSFLEVISFPLDYDRDYIGAGTPADWQPWVSSWIWTSSPTLSPQPILSDIEFDVDGSLVLGFMDRTGHQVGQNNIQIDGTGLWSANSGGDLLRICKINGTYVLEGNTGCGYNQSPLPNIGTGGEYYFGEENSAGSHQETSLGGIALLPGSGEVAMTGFSPIALSTGGIYWLDNTTGAANKKYELYDSNAPGNFSKASGLGDIEIMCTVIAPLEIGNYVWCDSIRNGLQDACEKGVDSMIVQLFSVDGTLVGQDTTANNGQYYFNQNNVDTTGITVDGSGVASPVTSWTGMNYNTKYYLVFGNTQYVADEFNIGTNSYEGITTSDVNSNGNDNIDSDVDGSNLSTALGDMPAGLPLICISTDAQGCGNHRYDMGLLCLIYDWGDLSDTSTATNAGDYQTTVINNGPRHVIIPGLSLGTAIDEETDGQPSTNALGDGADEDGINIFPTLDISPGGTLRIPLSVTNTTGDTAYVEAWIDWNGDGDFTSSEIVADLKDNKDGVFPSYIEIIVPTNAAVGSLLGFRVRLSNTDNMTPYGRIDSGEVEDYLIGVACEQICLPINCSLIRK